jgi:hypothetical protein
MDYELIAVSDTDPTWNPTMESWWNSGGALLWNQYGGFGTDRLILSEVELKSFVELAAAICGWQPSTQGPSLQTSPENPVIIKPYSEPDESPRQQETLSQEQHLCCSDCGRPYHQALISASNEPAVLVSLRDLNHVLNSLQEAIDFSVGKGPNNRRTWEVALEDFVSSMRGQQTPRPMTTPEDESA